MLTPMDDTFMRAILGWCNEQDKCEISQWILQGIFPREHIRVKSAHAQHDFKQAAGLHSAVFDLYVQDDHASYDVEFQKSALQEGRLVFYSAVLALHTLKAGSNYNYTENFCTIFLAEPNIVQDLAAQPVEKGVVMTLGKTHSLEEDTSFLTQRVVLINARYDGNDELGRMLQDLQCADARQIRHPILRKIATKLKNTEEGQDHMCTIMEEYGMRRELRGKVEGKTEGIAEGIAEGMTDLITKMLKDGFTNYDYFARISGFSIEYIKELAKKVQS